MEILEPPRIEERPEIPTFGVRVVTSMAELFAEVGRWIADTRQAALDAGAEPIGPPYLRLYVVDMEAEMDVEWGWIVAGAGANGSFPAGSYAALTYRGDGIAGNRALLDWIAAEGRTLDMHESPAGDVFACRYERLFTETDAEVAIRLGI
jgi:hypothetical protein